MLSLTNIKARILEGGYAWPGGYPIFAIMGDSEAMSFQAVKDNWALIISAHLFGHDIQWTVEAFDINYEDENLYCAHTSELIECAYESDLESKGV